MKGWTVISALLYASFATAQTATEALDAIMAELEKSTLRSEMSLSVEEKGNQPFTYNGRIEMRGELFCVDIFGTEAAYDGKTLYLYSEDTDELTLTTPTQDELTEANPILFAKALRLKSTVRFSAVNKNDKLVSLDIIPDFKEAGMQKIVFKYYKDSLLPRQIQLIEDNQTTTLLFNSPAYVQAPPQTTINRPSAVLVDLRD